MTQTELCMYIAHYWEATCDAVGCIMLQQITIMFLCCITETAKIAGILPVLSDTCMFRKMSGYKLSAFLEMLLFTIRKIYCHISERKCSCIRIFLGDFFVTVTLILLFSQNLHLYEKLLGSWEGKSGTLLIKWRQPISWQVVPHLPN